MADQIYRQWELIKWLIEAYGEKGLTIRELKQKLGVDYQHISERTLQRDLVSLSAVFDIQSKTLGATHYWSFNKRRNDHFIGLLGLTTAESISLLMIENHLQNLLPVLEREHFEDLFKVARKRIGNSEEPSSVLKNWFEKVRLLPAGQKFVAPAIDPQIQRVVYEALLKERQLCMEYQPVGKSLAHYEQVNPLALVQKGVAVYLIITLKTYQNPLILTLHRIKTATLLETERLLPDQGFDIDTFIEKGGLGFGQPDQWINLVVIFRNYAGYFLRETPLCENQHTVELKDGELEINAHIPYTRELVWWLTGFGPDVEIIEPASLREEIQRRHQIASRQA